MSIPAAAISINAMQKQQLESWARAGTTPQRVARKCKVVLLASQGASNSSIAQQTGLSRPTVLATRAAFSRGGCEALRQTHKRRESRRAPTSQLQQLIVDTTLQARPPGGGRGSVRKLARHLGVSRMRVYRVWQRCGLQPQRMERFRISNQAQLEETVRGVAGLYLDPPHRVLVLCADEKGPIQALDRTAPPLPLLSGLPERQMRDYKGYGTSTLFAAFNILNGKAMGHCQPHHGGRELVNFLGELEKEVPLELDIHVIMETCHTPNIGVVQRWLKSKKRRRFHLHLTPTGSSWLDQVEGWFALLAERMNRHGTLRSVTELERAIYQWLANWNEETRPFVWTAPAEVVLGMTCRSKELTGTASQLWDSASRRPSPRVRESNRPRRT